MNTTSHAYPKPGKEHAGSHRPGGKQASRSRTPNTSRPLVGRRHSQYKMGRDIASSRAKERKSFLGRVTGGIVTDRPYRDETPHCSSHSKASYFCPVQPGVNGPHRALVLPTLALLPMLFCAKSVEFMAARLESTWPAKASCISKTSMSFSVRPASSSTFSEEKKTPTCQYVPAVVIQRMMAIAHVGSKKKTCVTTCWR